MPAQSLLDTASKAYVITGSTSGIGRATALELAQHGTLVMVGRNPSKLKELKNELEQQGHATVPVVCDVSDLLSVKRAAAEIVALGLPIVGLLNIAGISPMKPSKSAQGWDLTFATNYLGPFALSEALLPHLSDGSNVLFVASAVEDPERKSAKILGMRGGRYISVEASANGEWEPGGSTLPGADAYATSKQCVLAASLALARENPRLRINAVEPGITPGTGLGGDANAILKFLFGRILTNFPPFRQYRSTPERAAKVLTSVATATSSSSGLYYDENGKPMLGSARARDTAFQDRVVRETRVFLAGHR